MKTVLLPDGHTLPALGLGTWRMVRRPSRAREVSAVRRAFAIGYPSRTPRCMVRGCESVVASPVRAMRPRHAPRILLCCPRSLRTTPPVGGLALRSQPPRASGSTSTTSCCLAWRGASSRNRLCIETLRARTIAARASATSMSTICPTVAGAGGWDAPQHLYSLPSAATSSCCLGSPQHHINVLFASTGRVSRSANSLRWRAARVRGAAGTRLDRVARHFMAPRGRAEAHCARTSRPRRSS